MPISNKKLTDIELQKLIQLIEKTKFDYKLHLYETNALKEINKSVARARNDISRRLAKIKPDSKFSIDRMNALAEEMQDLTRATQAQITGQITNTTITAGAEAYTKHNEIMSFGGRVPGFNPVALSAVQLRSLVTKTPVGGKLLNEWVSDNFSRRLQADFKSQITTGMLMGESYKDLVKRFDRGLYHGLEMDVESLTRTYVQSVNVNAMQDVAKANSDIVKGWKWSSVVENRTCVQCLSLDSADIIYKIDEGPEMPAHPRCRCFPELITKTFRELGVDVDEIKEAYRPYTVRGNINAETGAITAGKVGTGGGRIISSGRFLGTYEDYFNGASAGVKRQILGPSRYELWRSGKVSLVDMTDKNGRIRLLKELN